MLCVAIGDVMRVLRNELRLWTALARWLSGRHDGRLPGAYSYRGGLQPLLVIVLVLAAFEGAVVETVLVLALGHTVWPWLALVLHLYALGWLTGHGIGRAGLRVGKDGAATLGHGATAVEPGRPFRTLAISVDEPAAFVRDLTDRAGLGQEPQRPR
jgi:hypothetical protein